MWGSATSLPLESGSVSAVVTDPPYYDNVMYAELSDYFYVWLKRSLRDTWPELTTQALTDKEDEAVANPRCFERCDRKGSQEGRREVSEPSWLTSTTKIYSRSPFERHIEFSNQGAS